MPTAHLEMPTAGLQMPTTGWEMCTAGFQMPTAGWEMCTAGLQMPAASSQMPTAGSSPPPVSGWLSSWTLGCRHGRWAVVVGDTLSPQIIDDGRLCRATGPTNGTYFKPARILHSRLESHRTIQTRRVPHPLRYGLATLLGRMFNPRVTRRLLPVCGQVSHCVSPLQRPKTGRQHGEKRRPGRRLKRSRKARRILFRQFAWSRPSGRPADMLCCLPSAARLDGGWWPCLSCTRMRMRRCF